MFATGSDHPLAIDDKVRRLTFVLGLSLWIMGVLFSRMGGSGWDQAILKATDYALSNLAGWAVYLLLRKSSFWSSWELILYGTGGSMISLSLLQPTRTPWPLPAMLTHGVVVQTLYMGLAALVVRWIKGRRRSAREMRGDSRPVSLPPVPRAR